jgi:hypothetical protein
MLAELTGVLSADAIGTPLSADAEFPRVLPSWAAAEIVKTKHNTIVAAVAIALREPRQSSLWDMEFSLSFR